MRLWLDEMIPAEVARQLRRLGYDAHAVQEPDNRWAWGLDDPDQLVTATRQGRVLVSYNARDFIPISQQWLEAQREHLGIILVHPRTIPPHDIGGLVRSLAQFVDAHPSDDPLKDRVAFL